MKQTRARALGKIGIATALTYGIPKALALVARAIGWEEAAQSLDLTANALPYAGLTWSCLRSYNPNKGAGLPSETLPDKLTKAGILGIAGGKFFSGALDSYLNFGSPDYWGGEENLIADAGIGLAHILAYFTPAITTAIYRAFNRQEENQNGS